MDWTLKPIGYVRSEFKDRKMPPWGAPAAVELLPEFEAGLLRFEKHSHFWVMAWLMARPERDVLQVVPRGVDPDSESPMHGVFSVRSPARPNPIGLTAAELVRRDGLMLHFDRLDFVDGTAVVDLKPYFVARDMIYAARNDAVGRPKTREALRESLEIQALRYQPMRHADVALAVRLMEHFRITVMDWREPAEWRIRAPLDRPELGDALMGITRVTLARGMSFGPMRINDVEYHLASHSLSYGEVLTAEEKQLFQLL